LSCCAAAPIFITQRLREAARVCCPRAPSQIIMAKKPLRIGLIGYGFMGRAHSNAYAQAGHFFPSEHKIVLQAVCGRDAAAAQKFAEKWGYKSIETDWKKLIERDDIDIIDIATPNNLHSIQAITAAKAGKGIL